LIGRLPAAGVAIADADIGVTDATGVGADA
jgi:hypothetical protein